jgi:glutathione S-transferase
MGSGLYSQKLSYKDWYTFNCAQRVHLNFVESIATYLILLLVAGLYNPIVTAILGATLIVGRIIYGIGYMISPILRVPGALIVDIGLVGLTGLAGYSAWTITTKRKWF